MLQVLTEAERAERQAKKKAEKARLKAEKEAAKAERVRREHRLAVCS